MTQGEAIEVGFERGWAFYELEKINASRGGATRAEVDALRLMAIFLHHWDNKSSNQRLTCANAKTADCTHPLAMIQDVGSEFGPTTISRFYSLHMLAVPGLIIALIGAHLYLVTKLGTTAPPWLKAEKKDLLREEV